MNNNMSFGEALGALKAGHKVARKGWNGKNQYVELATSISYKNAGDQIVNAEHKAIGNAALAFVGTSGVQLGWLASQADMLAEDWYCVDSDNPLREINTSEMVKELSARTGVFMRRIDPHVCAMVPVEGPAVVLTVID